jgi:pyruvate dehydrogenase E1 component alpha subunit
MPLGRSDAPQALDERLASDDDAGVRVASFEIRYRQYLDHNARVTAALPEFAHDPSNLVDMYRACLVTREFDAKAVALQRTGQLGTYPSSLGQEATAVGLGFAMQAEDVLLPTYRETGTMLHRGVRMADILLYWGGDERGMAYATPAHDFPICVPIATHAPHAVGVAYAMMLRRDRQVAVCALGDGATSKGEFYEAINAAGVWQLPVLFLVVNNQWAISVPRGTQTRARTLAQKAIAAGIEAEQVDGNDPIGVRHVLEQALRKARDGRPQLVEALTYRLSDHTTADDARRYRSDPEVAKQRELDPLKRMRNYLVGLGIWNDDREADELADIRADLEEAVEEYLGTPARDPATIFEHLFATLPKGLQRQRDRLVSGARRHD